LITAFVADLTHDELMGTQDLNIPQMDVITVLSVLSAMQECSQDEFVRNIAAVSRSIYFIDASLSFAYRH